MKRFKDIRRIFLLLFAIAFSCASAESFSESAQNSFRYGPNLSWILSGNTPFVWGQWLPQAYGAVHYSWLEPLGLLEYGERLGKSPTYLRMDAGVEVSPFYGGYQAGLGVRPFKINPQIEFNITYESYLYFKSNLEMVTADVVGGGKIEETWNADYIVDNAWGEDAEFDYVQLIDMSIDLSYYFLRGSIVGVTLHYIKSDVSTDFDGKSYDYKLNIPVFTRDFIVLVETYGRLPINENWAAIFETSYYRTGYLRNGSTVEKESLGYGKALAGAHFSWNKGLQNISLELGGWRRTKKDFYDGSLSQQFLVQLEYQGYLSFPFHRNFTE